MRKPLKPIVPLMVSAVVVAGCASEDGPGTWEVVGSIGGVVVGALLGAQVGSGSGQIIATVVSDAAGGYLGKHLGKKLDERDRRAAQQAAHDSMEHNPDGVSSKWQNPNTGHSGTVRPTYTYYDSADRPCRDFTHVMSVDGQEETVKGTACRNASGQWEVEN